MSVSPESLTLVSAADERYARSLEQLLLSVERVYSSGLPGTQVWDLGLRSQTARAIARRFPFVQLRTLDFCALPTHLRIRERTHNSNGWKPLVIRAVAAETHGVLFWLDSATVLIRPLDALVAEVRAQGLYTPFGGRGTIGELTHPETLRGMHAKDADVGMRQRASGVIGFDLEAPLARELLDAWCDAALDAQLLAPAGANHDNHRFDQSLWNLLLAAAARRHPLQLTSDEIDVSSAVPAAGYRTRNKVPGYLPLATDPLVRAFYALRRGIDVAWWKRKLRG